MWDTSRLIIQLVYMPQSKTLLEGQPFSSQSHLFESFLNDSVWLKKKKKTVLQKATSFLDM